MNLILIKKISKIGKICLFYLLATVSCAPSSRYKIWELKQSPFSDAQDKSAIATRLLKYEKILNLGAESGKIIYLRAKVPTGRAISVEIKNGCLLIHEPIMGGSSLRENRETQKLILDIKQILETDGTKFEIRGYNPLVFDIA